MANEGRIAAVVVATLLCGCAVSKEARVRSTLMSAGLPEPLARCMAKPMAEDLSIAELQALGDAAKLARKPIGDVAIADALQALRKVGDPKVISVMAAASFTCIGKI